MNKYTILIWFFCFLVNCVVSQSIPKWQITASWGIEKHDKRLFDYSEKESLLAKQPENWGTYNMGISLRKSISHSEPVSILFGVGIIYEKATFVRPFSQLYFGDLSEILLTTNEYKTIQVPLSLSVIYHVGNFWFISGETASNLTVYRSIDHTDNNSDVFPYTESSFDLDEVYLGLGVNYRVKQFFIGINSRVLNYQKIDKIIFNSIVKDPRTDQKWEWNNPLRFDVTIGYMW